MSEQSIISTLIERVSCGRLTAPAPTKEQMTQLFKAALRAPDHKGLKPWKYMVFEGDDSLNKLGDMYLQASLLEDPNLDESQQLRMASLPHRAPMVVVAIAEHKGHEKVPHIEEVVSTGAGIQNMVIGAYALGFGAYWRTGPLAYNQHLKSLLGLSEQDTIVGFLYLGTSAIETKSKPVPEVTDSVRWC